MKSAKAEVKTVDFRVWCEHCSIRIAPHEDKIAADGKTYHQRYHFLFTVRGGKIHEMREYFDTMHANDVLCSAPAPGFNQ